MADHPDDTALTHTRNTHLARARAAADAAVAAETAGDHQQAAALRREADDALHRADAEDRQLRADRQRRRAALAHTLAAHHPEAPSPAGGHGL